MCKRVIVGYDTGCNPIMGVACQCGTTGCRNITFPNPPSRCKDDEDGTFTTKDERKMFDVLFGKVRG